MQHVWVTDDGVHLHRVEPPFVSMYGKVMRPGWESDDLYPWQEISVISLSGFVMPDDGARWVELVIDFPYGEFVTVGQEAEGFEEAVRAIAARAGGPEPDLSALEGSVDVWPKC